MTIKTLIEIAGLSALLAFAIGCRTSPQEKMLYFPRKTGLKPLPLYEEKIGTNTICRFKIKPVEVRTTTISLIPNTTISEKSVSMRYYWSNAFDVTASKRELKRYGLENENPGDYRRYLKSLRKNNKQKDFLTSTDPLIL